MSAPLDMIYGGRQIVGTSVDGQAVVVKLSLSEEGDTTEESAYWRQPLGLRSRPRDGAADTFIVQDGDSADVLLAWAPEINIGGIDTGCTQIYSVGVLPQHIEVGDDHIYLGTTPTDDVLLGTTYRTFEQIMNNALLAQLTAAGVLLKAMMSAPAPAPPNPVDALKQAGLFIGLYPGLYVALDTIRQLLANWLLLLTTFEGGSATFLSKLVKTQ